jgi:hypothetical protein
MDSIPDQHPSAEHDQITRSVFDDLMARLDPRDRSVAQLSLKMGATQREVAAATGRDVHEIYESIACIKRAARGLIEKSVNQQP